MAGRQSGERVETLFSLEILVEYIRVDKQTNVSGELAVAIRLLDFPTLLIYQPRGRSGRVNLREHGTYVFNRGKSCFFTMNLSSLHVHLSRTPLYAMVLDVKGDLPKLVGSSMVSLAKAVDGVRRDVTLRGVSTPSSHGDRGCVCIRSLTGENIGSLSLSFKLLSLGASLHTHVRDMLGHDCIKVQECIKETNKSTELFSPDCSHAPDRSDVNTNIQSNRPANTKATISQNKDENHMCVNDEHMSKSQIPQTPEESDNTLEEDLSLFCPPYMYYTNSAEERRKAEEPVDFTLQNVAADAFPFEDSEDETAQSELEGPHSPATHRQAKQNAAASGALRTSTLGESLRQLPLLNALLVELSQLTGQNLEQPLSVHPSLAWIYRPASAEPSAGQGKTRVKAQVKSPQNTEHLKLPDPTSCSTQMLRPTSVKKNDKKQEALIKTERWTKSSKKLVYGTTKTFNLRLKHISPSPKRRECTELMEKDARAKTKKITRSSKRKMVMNQSSRLQEHIETMIESVTMGSALQETVTIKQNKMHTKLHGKQDGDAQTASEHCSLSERDLKCIYIPTVNSDSVARNKDKTEHHSESNQSRSDSDRHRKKLESSRSITRSSSKSSFSDSGGEGNQEGEYSEDFNSLGPSDAYSPDPTNGPEPSRTESPKYPVSNSDSDSEVVQKRAALPVPIRAPSSPQRALGGTYVIRPKTRASALSFSSDDGPGSSLRSVCSRKQATKSIRLERTFGAESVSSRGDKSESLKSSGPLREFSVDSASSRGPQEAEELEDEFGSLDFRKEYQHISELVSNKLPGYTM